VCRQPTCEFRKAVNLVYGEGGLKLEINIPLQHILAKSKGGLIIKRGVSSSEFGTIFQTSENGWINKELFHQWFKLFIEFISPTRPILVIHVLDGHSSHVIDLIEMARLNDVHLLCLPSQHPIFYSRWMWEFQVLQIVFLKEV